MKKIIYRQGEGIAVITPTHSIDEAMKDIPKGVEYKIIDESELPKDRTFRNAWNFDLKEDLEKSKEIWKDKLRVDRKPLLAQLDIDAMRATEEKKSLTNIIKEKDRLRDITLLVDNCKTISAIKEVTV